MNWQSQIIELLTASLIRPLVLAAAAVLILHIYRVRHPASRHAVWTAVLIGMMVLPIVSFVAPQWKLPLLPKKPEPIAQTQLQPSDNFTDTEFDVRPNTVSSASQQAVQVAWPGPQTLIVWCYFAGVLAMAIFRLMGWALLWRVMSKSRLLRARLHESSEVITPVTVGVLRPSVILPAGWRDWSASTKRAVLAHEFAHIRRCDTLTSSVTRLAKCIYWFHPLAWWISRQMSELAELSCDAAALEKNGDPGGYSRILLSFAETVNAAGYRTALPGLAIASRSGMSHRIDQVFELAGGNLRKLSRPGTVLAFMGLPVIGIAAVVGLTAPATQVLNHPTAAISPSQPLEVAQSQVPTISPLRPPQPTSATAPPPASRPTFDSASIKPCSPNDVPANGGRSGRGGAGARYFSRSPGRISVTCMSVSDLIGIYVDVWGENDRPVNSGGPSDTQPIRGGPSWVYSDRYTIEAATADPVANGPTDGSTPASRMLQGPMLQALLEDRFQLKTHRDLEDVPMYALTVAKGGFKLKPMEDGGCIEPTGPPRLYFPGPDEKPPCHSILTGRKGPDDPNFTLVAGGSSLSAVAGMLSGTLDRHIIDKTGITGIFNIRLEFARDENAPGSLPPGASPAQPSETPVAPSIFTVLEQQLGLKLVPDKGPRGYIVIDHVERPSEN